MKNLLNLTRGMLLACTLTTTFAWGQAGRVANTSVKLPHETPVQGYRLADAFPNLRFDSPVAVAFPPGETNRLFVVERLGRVIVIPDLAQPTKEIFLDLTTNTLAYGEAGLLGLAFHPGFATNRQFYLYRTLSRVGEGGLQTLHDQLSLFKADPINPNRANPDSEVAVLYQADISDDHNAGDVHFGPDGYLYLSIGDNGPPASRAPAAPQSLAGDWFGCLLRIDVDKRPGNLPPNPLFGATTNYAIPTDNPFIGLTQYQGNPVDPSAIRTELFAIGLRNPWRFSFDPLTGDLFAGDVGSALWEEVNFIKSGGNYGWPFVEGNDLLPAAPPGLEWTPPAHAYLHGLSPFRGNCVIGGLFYQEGTITNLIGKYVCGDSVSGNLWSFSRSGDMLTNQVWLAGDNEGISCFGRDPRDGEVLVGMHSSGAIKRLIYTPPELATAIPTLLSDTGIFTTLTNLAVADGIEGYDINLPFWSDNAIKSRWFSVPDPSVTIGFEADGNWSFPTGTFWVKHFEIELTDGVPASRQRLETRVLVRSVDGVYGLTYKWDATGTNAVLLPPEGADEELIIDAGDGMVRTQTWHYPTRYECRICHNSTAGYALGFGTAQLNRKVSNAWGKTDQIARLSEAGYFASPVPDRSLLRSFSHPTNTAYPLMHRARSYLSVNCVQCHQVNSPVAGPSYAGWDARITTPVKDARLVDGYRIKPGVPEDSYLLHRFATPSSFRMPPLASTIIHAGGYDLLADWVKSMPQPPWTNLDIGAPLFDGASEATEEGFVVSSAGSGLSDTQDAFQYLSQSLAGNGQIIARLVPFDSTTPGAVAGLMIRNGMSSNASYAFLGQSESGLVLTARATDGGVAQTGGDAGRLEWLRLARNQNQISGYGSADGQNWSLVGSTEVLLPQSATIGMAVTGGNSSKFSNAHFENVSLLSVNWSTLAENVQINLPTTITLAVDVNAHMTTVARVEFLVDGELIGEVFEVPYEVVWANATAGSHSLVARVVDAYGNIVEAPPRSVTASLPDSTAYFHKTEAAIHGNWSAAFGTEGYLIAGNMSSLPDSVIGGFSNATAFVWADPTDAAAALWKADSEQRIAAAWTADTEISLRLGFLDGVRRDVALYFLDWTPTNAHALSVDVFDDATGELLDHQAVTDFTGGKYLVWAVNGMVRFAIRSLDGGLPVVSGVFLNPNSNPGAAVQILTPHDGAEMVAPANPLVQVSASHPVYPVSKVELLTNGVLAAIATEPPYDFPLTDLGVGEYQLVAGATDLLGDVSQSEAVRYVVNYPPSKATFYRSDSLTRGAWIGPYGTSGYLLFGRITNLPPATSFSIYPGLAFVGRHLSDREWALRIPGEPNGYGIEAEWAAPGFSLQLSFPDGREHLCGFYVSDYGGHYRETGVEITDALTGELLNSQILQGFSTGKYYFWQLSGRLNIQFKRLLGGNVGLAGIFLDPALPPAEIWRGRTFNESQFGNLSLSGWSADPDQDHISNLAEFAMGLDPWNPDRLPFSLADDHLYLSYTRSREALNFQFTPEYSTNLLDWLSGPLWVEVVGSNADGVLPSVSVRGVRTIKESPTGYLRLRITP